MPGPDLDTHGIGKLIQEINQEYQQTYNTTDVIFNQGDTEVTVEVPNNTVSGGPPSEVLVDSKADLTSSDSETTAGRVYDGGTKLFTCGTFDNLITKYTLSTPYDVTTASASANTYTLSYAPYDIAFKPDGTRLATLNDSGKVNMHDLSTAWDLSSASAAPESTTIDEGGRPIGMHWEADGSHFYISDQDLTEIRKYEPAMGTWELNTDSSGNSSYLLQTFDNSAEIGRWSMFGMSVGPRGKRLYAVNRDKGAAAVYSLSTKFDLSTAEFEEWIGLTHMGNDVRSVAFGPDGLNMIATDNGTPTLANHTKELVF